MTRKEKIKLIQGILTGSVSLNDIRKEIIFLTFRQCKEEPGTLYDASGNPLKETEVLNQVQQANERGLVWNEILSYESKSSLLNSYQ